MDVWSDKKRQNQERTHTRNDESSAGVQKDNGEKTEMVWARHEDGRRSRSEESDDECDTGERKRGRPKTRWKDVCKRDMQTVGLREGDEGDMTYWKETIDNHSGDPIWREKPEEKKKEIFCSYNRKTRLSNMMHQGFCPPSAHENMRIVRSSSDKSI